MLLDRQAETVLQRITGSTMLILSRCWLVVSQSQASLKYLADADLMCRMVPAHLRMG